MTKYLLPLLIVGTLGAIPMAFALLGDLAGGALAFAMIGSLIYQIETLLDNLNIPHIEVTFQEDAACY